MSKFKPLSAYNNLTPPQPSPTTGVVVETTQTGSPSPSNTPATVYVAECAAIFLIDHTEGEFTLEHFGTPAVLEEVFQRYSTQGVTVTNQRGFVWYSPAFTKKITVKY